MPALRIAAEAHFHTRMQVQGYLEIALAIMDDAVVPDRLAEATLPKLLDLLSQKQVTFEQVGATGVLLDPNGNR
jgi:hypothetical protein